MRDESDEDAIAHHLRLESRGAVGVPDRLATVEQVDADPALVRARPGHVRRHATCAQRVDDPPGLVLVHPRNLARRVELSGSLAALGHRTSLTWTYASHGRSAAYPSVNDRTPAPARSCRVALHARPGDRTVHIG